MRPEFEFCPLTRIDVFDHADQGLDAASGVPLNRQRDRDPDGVSIRPHETLFKRDFGNAAEQQRSHLAFMFGAIVRMRQVAQFLLHEIMLGTARDAAQLVVDAQQTSVRADDAHAHRGLFKQATEQLFTSAKAGQQAFVFLLPLPQPQERSHSGVQFFFIDWLDQVPVGTDLEPHRAIRSADAGRRHVQDHDVGQVPADS